jgi:hypothetical protein
MPASITLTKEGATTKGKRVMALALYRRGKNFIGAAVLKRRGYVARDPATGEYTLTLKLFRIASQFPPTERLLKAALPVMEQLASRVQLSCHLTVLHGEQFMVVARVQPEWLMGLVSQGRRGVSAHPAIRIGEGSGGLPARRPAPGVCTSHRDQ